MSEQDNPLKHDPEIIKLFRQKRQERESASSQTTTTEQFVDKTSLEEKKNH